MHNVELDVSAPILPNEGLGGLRLRTPISQIERFVFFRVVNKPKSYALVSPFEAKYCLADGAISVYLDVRNGTIFQLSAGAGYEGTLFGAITVGMRVQEAMNLDPRLYYEEDEELLLFRGCEGVALNVPAIDPAPELVLGMVIESISVYVKELDTPDAQVGYL